jgi:hypothetical protein
MPAVLPPCRQVKDPSKALQMLEMELEVAHDCKEALQLFLVCPCARCVCVLGCIPAAGTSPYGMHIQVLVSIYGGTQAGALRGH